MSRKPPAIVAELGRPETAQETADRKAASSARYRGSKTLVNLVAAMLACAGIVIVMVLVVMRPGPAAPEPIDVSSAAADASASLDARIADPEVPGTWAANAAELRSGPAGVEQWYVGWITAEESFASLTQGVGADGTWLAATTREAVPTGTLEVDGVEWELADQRDMDDPGNLAWVAWTQAGDSTYVVAGTAGDDEMQTLVEAVTAELPAS